MDQHHGVPHEEVDPVSTTVPLLPGGKQTSGVGAWMFQGKGGRPGLDESLIPMTAREVRRLLTRFVWMANHLAELVLSWSLWRRHNQAQARRCYYQRRLSLLASVVQL